MPTEADTCRKLVVPKLQVSGWDSEPYSIAEQRTITDGRVVPVGNKPPQFLVVPSERVAAESRVDHSKTGSVWHSFSHTFDPEQQSVGWDLFGTPEGESASTL
jgi:hypothetical protein